jgi:nicotinate-nucleotide adenylyltransferase
MTIGLYFGSFNPIHVGHLIIAQHILNHAKLNKIWFVVSPQNPLKEKSSLLNEYKRLNLVKLGIEDNNKFKAIDIEFKLPKPSYTIDTLTYLKEKYPNYNFNIIMGSDGYSNISKWKNYEVLLNNYKVLVYNRPNYAITQTHKNVEIINAPLLDISATYIRSLIKQNKDITYLVPPMVQEEILKGKYYS